MCSSFFLPCSTLPKPLGHRASEPFRALRPTKPKLLLASETPTRVGGVRGALRISNNIKLNESSANKTKPN